MNDWLSLVLGLFLGIIPGVIISRYYYFKQVDKKLTPYIHLASPILKGTDPNIRKSLKIHYHDKEVEDLFDLQIIVANEGHKPIRNYIEPLSLDIPNNIEVLDTSVLYTRPRERDVSIKVVEVGDQKKIEFHFSILNSGDFFLIKILLDGIINPEDLVFHITDEDLPSSIKPIAWPTVRITPGQDTETKERRPSKINLFFCLIMYYLSSVFALSSFFIYDSGFLRSSPPYSIIAWIMLITLIALAILTFIFGILLFLPVFNIERELARRRFSLPNTIKQEPNFPIEGTNNSRRSEAKISRDNIPKT